MTDQYSGGRCSPANSRGLTPNVRRQRGNADEGMAVTLGVVAVLLLIVLAVWYGGGLRGWWTYPQALHKTSGV